MASKVMDEHEKCRRKICIICKNKGDRSLIPSEIAIIEKYLFPKNLLPKFEEYMDVLPTNICACCRNALFDLRKSKLENTEPLKKLKITTEGFNSLISEIINIPKNYNLI